MSHQGRVRAPPAHSPAHSAGHAATPSRDAQKAGPSAEERCRDLELRLLASEAERRNLDGQKTRLEAALEECMDLLLQVSNDEGGGGKQQAQQQQQQQQAVSEAVAAAEERLHGELDEAAQRERAASAAERDGLRAQLGELRMGYEEAVADLRRCVQREEASRRDRDALDAEVQALRAQLRGAHDAAAAGAEARAAGASAAAALADERKRREEETQARRTLEGQLRALAQSQQRGESDLVADAQRIRTQLHERRSQGGGSEKWSLSPDNSPAATAAAAAWAKASCVGVPALPGAAANMGGGGGGPAMVAGLVGLGATPPRGMSPPQSARGGGGSRSTALSSPAPSAGRPSAFGSLPGTPAGTASVATPGASTAAAAAAASSAATPAQLSVTVPVLRPIQYYHATTTTPHNASVDVI